MHTVNAKDYRDLQGLIVSSAERLSESIIPWIRDEEAVRVSMDGLFGVSSTYFNTVLLAVRDACGDGAVQQLEFQFTSDIQRDVYERSRDAILALPR
ncbi:MAG TPA: hypothetical protein PKB10_05025 [Tepidisphaeraceae bacterium]|nr:hypothetical protein [Tepidisphaeraceae bacterium]